MKVCFTASSGGHFEQLMMLFPLMSEFDGFLITEKTSYSSPKEDLKTYYVPQVNRKELFFSVKILIVFLKTIRILMKEKPDVIISTGALATIPALVLGKALRKKVIFIESFSKIHSPTITGKIVYKFADVFIVQWEEMKIFYPKAIYAGGIY
ncbi:PssD/Cps14F family polysaccharide biosynthesis glycosyltransferase [Planococcus maritimus]|nr:PssD/Cps14F family polysaccharide biosynthesis glycosyltransferase [Planococcus sp. SK3692]MDE4085886.1 PssD/Cps14F family polysaccharide biosynthesis glycosyltransferase [Planococcus maritimus]